MLSPLSERVDNLLSRGELPIARLFRKARNEREYATSQHDDPPNDFYDAYGTYPQFVLIKPQYNEPNEGQVKASDALPNSPRRIGHCSVSWRLGNSPSVTFVHLLTGCFILNRMVRTRVNTVNRFSKYNILAHQLICCLDEEQLNTFPENTAVYNFSNSRLRA